MDYRKQLRHKQPIQLQYINAWWYKTKIVNSVFQLTSKKGLEFENNYSVCENAIFERTEKKYIPSLWWELRVFANGYIRVWTSNYFHVGIMEEECRCWRTSRDVSCRREMLISRLPCTRSQQLSVPIPRTKCSSAHISGETMHFSRALWQRLTGTRVWSELYPEQDVNAGVLLLLMLQKRLLREPRNIATTFDQ